MSSKPGIPAWQRAQPSAAPASSPTSEQEPKPAESEPESDQKTEDAEGSRSETGENRPTEAEKPTQPPVLLEQASRFLEDPAIRDAPREKKVAFLQSKGVKAEDIEELLATPAQKEASPDLSLDGEKAWSKTPPTPSQQSASSKPRDIPPIITYPEFLAQPVSPPPLITTQRLLNTAYITGGLWATIYGLSKYIVAPMAQNLAESRHELFSHTNEKLDDLNKRLAEVVSEDPAHKAASVSEAVDDVSEAGSDPTELFHRDIGTQTTPTLSRKSSNLAADEDTSTTASHARRVNIITSHLKELEEMQSGKSTSQNSLRTALSDLESYLTEMSYQSAYNPMPGLYGGTYGLPKADGKSDQIEAVKADIRAVKGVFLNARNFPAGGPSGFGRIGG